MKTYAPTTVFATNHKKHEYNCWNTNIVVEGTDCKPPIEFKKNKNWEAYIIWKQECLDAQNNLLIIKNNEKKAEERP